VGGEGGLGFVGVLTIAFIVLKLCHVIDWPWLWVLSPLWISLVVAAVVVLLVAIMFVVIYLFVWTHKDW
jgi:hypothetical protein